MSDETINLQGGCFCGAVRYRVEGPLRHVINCHCGECRKLNGSFGAHSKAPTKNLEITEDRGLRWFQITAQARRAFCGLCGSSLFWQFEGQPGTGIVAGTLDDSGNLRTVAHIFVDDKAGFYEIEDDLPQYPQSSHGELEGDTV